MKGCRRPIACISIILMLSGCIDSIRVQTDYVANRDSCRMRAETSGSIYSDPGATALSDKDRNAALLQLFCECMKDKDWKVSGCPKKQEPSIAALAAPTPPPMVVVVQSPSAQPAIIATPAAPAVAPAPTTIYEPIAVPTPAAPAHKAARKTRKKGCTPPQACPAPPAASSPATPVYEKGQLKELLERQ